MVDCEQMSSPGSHGLHVDALTVCELHRSNLPLPALTCRLLVHVDLVAAQILGILIFVFALSTRRFSIVRH
jgi:hypothetical protein